MSEHLSEQTIQAYLTRTMAPDELLFADDHLVGCKSCLKRIGSLSNLPSEWLQEQFLNTTDEDDHLTYEQLEAYVDHDIDEIGKEIIDAHKSGCRECSVQLDELFRIKNELEADAVAARVIVPSSSVTGRTRFWQRFSAYPMLRLAAAGSAVLVIGVAMWVVWLSVNRQSTEVAIVTDKPAKGVTNRPLADDNNVISANTANENSSNLGAVSRGEVVSLIDGNNHIVLDEKGNLSGLDAAQYEKRIRSVLANRDLEIAADISDLRHGTGVLMGDPGEGVPFALSSPVGKIVLSNRSQFRWQPLKNADSYVVEIYDANFNKIASSQPIRNTTWTMSQPLRRGIIYQWQVTAMKDGQGIKSPVRPAPDAKFKILDAKRANEIEQAKKNYSNVHLLLGTLYAEAGLLDDAEREFKTLLKKNPGSDLARKLLRKVQASK